MEHLQSPLMLQKIYEAYADAPGGMSEAAFVGLMRDLPGVVAGDFTEATAQTAFRSSCEGRAHVDLQRFSQALFSVAMLRYPESGASTAGGGSASRPVASRAALAA
jgi:hypothetical protein